MREEKVITKDEEMEIFLAFLDLVREHKITISIFRELADRVTKAMEDNATL